MWGTVLCVVAASSLVMGEGEYLLPGDVIPSHYDVKLAYDVDPNTNFSFFGVVDILLRAKRPTSKVVLHAQDFTIAEEKISLRSDNDVYQVTGVDLNDTYNFLTLQLDRELKEDDSYHLTLPFFGNLKLGLDGVYISSYVDKDTKKKEYLIATQFEAISARKGFPCFDEPIYKATFSINIGHPKDLTAVSNMPLKVSSGDNALENIWPWEVMQQSFGKPRTKYVWDEFDKSVPMSTYLVAFVVSSFAYVDSPPQLSSTKFRIWARNDAIDQTSYAATVGPRVLSYFEKFFNVTFPLPKQDMIAIPDFSAGAMENWGLITYRETALLYDKEQSSFVNKERVAEVIAHELAHQWFGNLVTMKWWSDLWLNEGFATFVASLGVMNVEPTWHADKSYAVSNIMSVLNLDALESSHPVSVEIDNPNRISEIFDEISYRKGSTLIRMMSMFLGEEVFRKALHNYLIKHSYGNAEQDDLWAELTQEAQKAGGLTANVTVKEVMDTWTKQTGYPILEVQRDYSEKSLTISQKRYLSLGGSFRTNSAWWVPLSVLCERDTMAQDVHWLSDKEGVDKEHRFEHGASPDEWVLFNYNMIAPYRVNYDARNWQLLVSTLTSDKFTQVPVMGRVQLLSDAFALAWTNKLDYATTLQLASYLQHEDDYLPLMTGLNALSKIENVLKRTPNYGAYQKFMRRLIRRTYEKSGGLASKKILNGDDLNSVKMQVRTSSTACRAKVPGCEENAIQLFEQWMNTKNPDENNPIPLDLRSIVYCVAIERGSVRHWRFALERRRRTNVAAAKDQLLRALSCSRDIWILAQYLEWSITDGSDVRRQDSASVITAVISSDIGYYYGKEFLYSRIEDIYKAFNGQGRRLGNIIKTLLNQFTTQRELDEFLKWYDQNSEYFDVAKLAVSQGIERARVNIAWIQQNQALVVDKLREYSHIESAAWRGKPIFMSSLYAIHNISSHRLKLDQMV
ncbi:aminopeptidase N-like isoform X2 [Pieris brassicae]|uniref:aminopeptidase N-like isoform X2 n=1 Tax=Pieris brassicae TaxID=7116 RepID=UPI001E65FE5F|nr:aminopeptidase N-like isoform X2 [Pieris brassicae]